MDHSPIISPDSLKMLFPVSSAKAQFIAECRHTVKRIITGKDPRKAIVVGPCSIHDKASALEYAARFKMLAESVKKTCFLVMRVYLEKPRTTTGWKGMIYDPHLDGSHDIQTGLLWAREILDLLSAMGVPAATEFVDPLIAPYVEDLITWGFIGARTSASQPHRQFASLLTMPIGFKNGTDGNIDDAVRGVISARTPHAFMKINGQGSLCAVQSEGNPFTHVVLRGSEQMPNYDKEAICEALKQLERAHLQPRLMIDCAHGNSQKRWENQRGVFESVLEQMKSGNHQIFGWMLESHLENGNQVLREDPSLLQYAVSITDPCIDWSLTEELVYSADISFTDYSSSSV
ncbi:MAG: 3-deoxy-7-phosphoheptulonate synthase [Rhabdochlamydiaceae bacterium]|nr:3-deoxy-7-phosphoheptulonate synthase [Rhabdochlamydiaceae bacterium]